MGLPGAAKVPWRLVFKCFSRICLGLWGRTAVKGCTAAGGPLPYCVQLISRDGKIVRTVGWRRPDQLRVQISSGRPRGPGVSPGARSLHDPSSVSVDAVAQQASAPRPPIGSWQHTDSPEFGNQALAIGLHEPERPLYVVAKDRELGVSSAGAATLGAGTNGANSLPLVAYVPPCSVNELGDASFRHDHGLRYAYLAGAMANGIASVALVQEMARAGMAGFFGAAGLAIEQVRAAVDELQATVGDLPHGFNLIHSPNEPELEAAVVQLYLEKSVRWVEASAYLDLTLPVVRYRVAGIHKDASGAIVTPNRVLAKVSRVEVASKFLAPPPDRFLQALVAEGFLTAEQAEWARQIPMAQDLTAEADSGGHTDNRPALALLPTLLALRDRMQAEHGYGVPLRVGAAGGIATPASVHAAFAMGAAFVVAGSIHQACTEAGTSDTVRAMLAAAEQADVIMAPAADMFEMGVQVQVLKRGTMFAMRGQKLYDLYRAHASLEAIPERERQALERTVFQAPLAEIWQQTRAFFEQRDPAQITRAEQDPKHKMALVFRWYLGKASIWANRGERGRQVDYQVWCGPAMGAFNEWVKGTYLEAPEARQVREVAVNLLVGAAVFQRLQSLRSQGIAVPPEATAVRPRPVAELASAVPWNGKQTRG